MELVRYAELIAGFTVDDSVLVVRGERWHRRGRCFFGFPEQVMFLVVAPESGVKVPRTELIRGQVFPISSEYSMR